MVSQAVCPHGGKIENLFFYLAGLFFHVKPACIFLNSIFALIIATVTSQALEGKPSMPKGYLFGRNSLPT